MNLAALKHLYPLEISAVLWPLGFASLPAGHGAWIPADCPWRGGAAAPGAQLAAQASPEMPMQEQELSWCRGWWSLLPHLPMGTETATKAGLQESHTCPAHLFCRMLHGDVPSHSRSQRIPSQSTLLFLGNVTFCLHNCTGWWWWWWSKDLLPLAN